MTELKVKKDFRQLSRDEIVNLFESLGEKKFRANQVYEWLWQKGVKSFDEMTNLSKTLREQLSSDYVINSLVIDTIQKSDDGTVKVRFKTFDNYFIEGVLIPADDRFTACVSSQVGCSLTCAFCATGKMKRERNLNFDEIFDQVVSIHQLCAKHYNSPLTNILFIPDHIFAYSGRSANNLVNSILNSLHRLKSNRLTSSFIVFDICYILLYLMVF